MRRQPPEQPGINEYTITHLSAHASEASFRVEGHGTSATIIDMRATLDCGGTTAAELCALERDQAAEARRAAPWDALRAVLFRDTREIDADVARLHGFNAAYSAAMKEAAVEHEKLVARQLKRDGGGRQAAYSLTITVEAGSAAPSVEARIDCGRPEGLEAPQLGAPSLRISYTVTNASWTPRYELGFDTVSGSGVLGFRAEVVNHCGESWEDAELTLATVETRGAAAIPELVEWRFGVGEKEGDEALGYSVGEWARMREKP